MRRLPLVLILVSCAFGAAHGRTLAQVDADGDAVVTTKPKRVLFRTDSPRLFAPKATPAAVPTPLPRKVETLPRRLAPSPTPLARPVAKTRAEATPAPARKPVVSAKSGLLRPPTPDSARLPERREIDFHPTRFTPYDRYLGTVRSVMANLDARPASMVTACELVQECRRFRYIITDLYRADPPAITESRRAGDCKAKALWLYDHLGDPGAYYVIGKLVQRSRTSHAWVYWRNNGRWWILDPTVRSAPIAADSVSPTRYVPYYSFSKAGSFRHSATRLMLASNGIPAASPTAAVREGAAESRRRAVR